jgi:hypothetical protein
MSEPAALDTGGGGVIEEKADPQSAYTVDEDVGQDVNEPKKSDRGGKAAQRERDETFYFTFLFKSHKKPNSFDRITG